MTGELRTDLPSSLSGSVSRETQTTESPELTEAREALDLCLTAFVGAGNRFLEAGGSPAEMMQKFQQAVSVPAVQG